MSAIRSRLSLCGGTIQCSSYGGLTAFIAPKYLFLDEHSGNHISAHGTPELVYFDLLEDYDHWSAHWKKDIENTRAVLDKGYGI